MDDGAPSLEVGFLIDAGGSFDELTRLAALMDTTEGRIVAEAAKIEKATEGMVSLGNATVQISAFGNAATKEMQSAAREISRVEKSGEALIRQLEKQGAAYGKTREELRAIKAETIAVDAESKGLTDLAQRIRAAESSIFDQEFAAARRARAIADEAAEKQIAAEALAVRSLAEAQHAVIVQLAERAQLEAAIGRNTGVNRISATDAGASYSALAAKAADDEARAATAAAEAEKRLADEHARLAALVRGSHDAQVADAEAAERMRMATDPLYASVKRLNAEIAESTRLYHVGATAPEEYARQQEVLRGRLQATTTQTEAMAEAGNKNAFALKMTALQIPDIVSGLATGQKPMQILFQQGGQIVQIAQMAEGGMAGFARSIGGVVVRFAPLLAVMAVAASAFELLKHEVSDDAALKAYAESLGLTHKEMEKLGDVSVTTGDLMAGLGKTIADRAGLGGVFDHFGEKAAAAAHTAFVAMEDAAAGYYAAWAGSYNAIVATWRQFPTVLADIVIQGANLAISGIEWLINKTIDGVNSLGGSLQHVDLGAIKNAYAGAGAAAASTFADEWKKSYSKAKASIEGFVGDVAANTMAHAEARLKKKADEIIADRTPKVDHHAEAVAREAAAVEAQIKNLYRLADAYGVSGAAALIAEAREKAESAAIKNRGDIDAAVDRQIRLAIAQRVADAAKSIAAMNDQAAAQEQVNALVEAGVIPESKASEAIQQRIALLPLLAAQQAAQQEAAKAAAAGDVGRQKEFEDAAAKATEALGAQTAAQDRLTSAKQQATIDASKVSTDNQIESLQAELRLIGATDAARTHELATIKAQQEAVAAGLKAGTADYDDYVARLVKVADLQHAVADAQAHFNDNLRLAIDLADSVATSLSAAFGQGGTAIGSALKILADYKREAKDLDDQRKAAIGDQERLNENAKRSADLQLSTTVGLLDATKGLFSEKSKGYKAIEAAEKAVTILQLANSAKTIAQDIIQTASSIANSTARASADVAAGGAKMFGQLGIGGFAAVAAMIGVMASLGFSGGGSSSYKPNDNTGTGTVLGDNTAKSESIQRSIDLLKDVDTLTMGYSRDMLTSLKSIDSQIGGLASLLVRTGNLDASASGVTEGFKTDAIGSVLSKVPLIGGILGSLFGTKTTIEQQGIYAAPQSLDAILSGGFDASTYADIQKKKKLFGLTTSTKYSTRYGGLDDDIQQQFALILGSFDDTIKAAAGPLGLATDSITTRLNSFVVSIGKVDLKGLTGTQIQDKLEAVFGAVGDDMARAAVPGLEKFEKVGEGYLETLTRVATTVETVDATMERLGLSTRSLGVDADMAIAGLFDSLSDFTSAAQTYFQTFYTGTEQASAASADMARAFTALGIAMPDSLAGFRNLVQAQDLTTAAGQQTYAMLLQLAPAFAQVVTAGRDATTVAAIEKQAYDLQGQLLELQGNTAATRERELAALDPSNRALQQRIYALQDEQAAEQAAAQAADAIAQQRAGLEQQLLQLQGDTATLRAQELAGLDESNRAIQQQIYALQDQQAATQAATQAAQDAASKQDAIAQERAGLETTLLQLQGNTAQLRANELAGLDASNRALQQQIYALQDAQTAAQAADQLREAWQSVGNSIMDEVKRIRRLSGTGDSSYASLLGQFNAATTAARGGDQDAAKLLPDLSKSLLDAAALVATSRQELDRIQAQTAGSLEDTYAAIMKATGAESAASSAVTGTAAAPASTSSDAAQWWSVFANASPQAGANDALLTEVRGLRAEVEQMHRDNNAGHAANAGNTGRLVRTMDNVTNQSGGDAIATVAAA